VDIPAVRIIDDLDGRIGIDRHQVLHPYLETGFLQDFTFQGRNNGFSGFNGPAWRSPSGTHVSEMKENFVFGIENDRGDSRPDGQGIIFHEQIPPEKGKNDDISIFRNPQRPSERILYNQVPVISPWSFNCHLGLSPKRKKRFCGLGPVPVRKRPLDKCRGNIMGCKSNRYA
jgi:hypothetical protein